MPLTLILFLYSANVLACTDAFKNLPEECKLQERYQKMRDDFKKISINIHDIQKYKLSRALSPKEINGQKNKFAFNAKQALEKNEEWHLWQNAQNAIAELNVVYLSVNDIQNIHKSIFGKKTFLNNVTSDAGKLRLNQGITNPRESIHCEDGKLDVELLEQFTQFDLTSSENYPLLELEDIKTCPNGTTYSAQVVYYKGASVKQELLRWVNDYNDMLIRFEKGHPPAGESPLTYMADMRRWFTAIAPFGSGNTEVANALTDYFMKRLDFYPLPLKDLNGPHLMKPDKHRESFVHKSRAVLTELETCLYENKVKPISADCSIL